MLMIFLVILNSKPIGPKDTLLNYFKIELKIKPSLTDHKNGWSELKKRYGTNSNVKVFIFCFYNWQLFNRQLWQIVLFAG